MGIDRDKIDGCTSALPQGGIRPLCDEERLDLSHCPEKSVEFGSCRPAHRQEYVQ